MAVAGKEFDFYKLYVCLLGTFALAFCRHFLYVAFWNRVEYGDYNSSSTSRGNEISSIPLHWVLLELGDGFGQTLSIQCPSNQTKETTPGITFNQLTFPYPVVLSGGNDVSFIQTPVYFTVGLTRVVFRATDSIGNSESCSFYVNLRLPDSTPPSLICPANQTEHLSAGQSSINITLPPPTHVVDNGGGNVAVTYSPSSGQAFSEGISEITVTATDESGNSESCLFYVIIKPPLDIIPPDLTCPPDQVQEVPLDRSGTDCFVLVVYPTPTATDDSGVEVNIESYPSSGGLFDSCTNFNGMEIEVRATDASDNVATCTFRVTWLEVATTMSSATTMRPATTVKATTREPTTTRPTTRQPTTRQPTTTRPPSTTNAPTTTRPPTTTKQPTTTRPSTTTTAPTTTRPTTTTKSPTTTRPTTTTKSHTTTRSITTTKSPTTTRPPTTTQQPTTTRSPTTTQRSTTRPSTTTKPTTTTKPHTTTLPPTTRPSTTTKPHMTTRPSTTTKAPTTTRPSATTKPPQTTRPSTTTKSPSTTRPPTTSGTTRPSTTTRKQTTRPTTKPMTTRQGTTKGMSSFTGEDICSPNPCQHEGICLRDPSNSLISCVCLFGYAGDRCEMSLDTTFAPNVSLAAGSAPESAIIAVIIGALAFVLIIFVMLTAIICCYNRDGSSRPRNNQTKKPEIEGHPNPVFVLDALDPDDDEKDSIASDELEHEDEQYQAKKDLFAAVTKAQEARTQQANELPYKPPIAAKTNTYTPTVTFAEQPDEHLYDSTPDMMRKENDYKIEYVNDYDEVSSIHSDHSYESLDGARKSKMLVLAETHDLPESEREEAEREAAVMAEIFRKEGFVRIPSTTSTQMSVKLNNTRLNNRYIHRK